MCITLHLDGRGEGEGMSMEEGGCPNDVMNGSYWIWLIVNKLVWCTAKSPCKENRPQPFTRPEHQTYLTNLQDQE